ncbi:MAG: hypothetical protein U0841_33405 [Chloroflexia bacterium]
MPTSADREFADEGGIDDVLGEDGGGPAGGAVGGDFGEVDDEGVARFGTFDVEGAGLRVAARGDLLAGGVAAARVDGGGDDGVAGAMRRTRTVAADRGGSAWAGSGAGGHRGPPV